MYHSFGTGTHSGFNNYSGSSSVRVSAAHSNHQWLRRQRNICSSASPLSILNYISAIVFLTNHRSEIVKYHFFKLSEVSMVILRRVLILWLFLQLKQMKVAEKRVTLNRGMRSIVYRNVQLYFENTLNGKTYLIFFSFSIQL